MYSRLFTFASALAVAAAIDFDQWSPPGPGDVRSPCPALNTLANHGILPHDGKGLTVPILQQALGDAFNIGIDLSTVLAVGGLLTSPNPLGLSFDLDNLDIHDIIEHDGSLSRLDFYQGGDDHTFQQAIWDTVLAFFGDSTDTSLTPAAKAHYMRVQNVSEADPDFTYGPLQFVLSYGETALYLSGMGDPVNGVVPVDYVKTFFEQERLPYDQGWRVPTTQINGLSIQTMIAKLIAAGGEAIPEGLIITNNTFNRAMLGLDVLGTGESDIVQTLINTFTIIL